MIYMINKKCDIIIFGGQSNMQGQSECLINHTPVDGCLEYRYITNEYVPLKDPVGEYIKTDGTKGEPFTGDLILNEDEFIIWLNSVALGASTDGNTSLVPSFCRSYKEKSGNNVIAVHVAKGATRIDQWLGDSQSYKYLTKKASRAIEGCKNKGKVYFVWLQGESDALASTSAELYEHRLIELKNNLKRDLAIDKFAIIRVGKFANDDRDLEIMKAQEAVCCNDGDFVMLTRIASSLNDKKEFMNQNVKGHFSAKGLELIGETAGAALAEICPVQ